MRDLTVQGTDSQASEPTPSAEKLDEKPPQDTLVNVPTTEPEKAPDNNGDEDVESMEEYADTVVTILIPVAITMILVVCAVRNLHGELDSGSGSGMTVYTEKSGDSNSTKFLGSLLNAIIIVAVIFAVTVVMVILYKFRLMKLLWGWILGSTAILLIGFCAYILYLFIEANNLLLDWISWAIIVYNFGVVGMIAVFWHAPRYINQAYLILISAFTAILFSRLPEWTTWMFLALIAAYDLFAVLFPKGPLKILLELSKDRNETIPALIYNASVYIVEPTSPHVPNSQQAEVPAVESGEASVAPAAPIAGPAELTIVPISSEPATQTTELSSETPAEEPAQTECNEVMRAIDLTSAEQVSESLQHVDSQGKLSPPQPNPVFVEIPLSPKLEEPKDAAAEGEAEPRRHRRLHHHRHRNPDGTEQTDSTTVADPALADSTSADPEHRSHSHRHRHHRHHHHRHRNPDGTEQTDSTTVTDPTLADATSTDPDHSHHSHRHHHHRHHHRHHRTALPQKSEDITQSPQPPPSASTLPDPNPEKPPAAPVTEEEPRGVKLGLGDFIFYSVLIGRAAMYDITTVFTCFIAIVTGLYLTLLCLAVFKRPLPALPVSIALGMIFYFLTRVFLVPYIKVLGLHQVFV